jgi:hypothetical protein
VMRVEALYIESECARVMIGVGNLCTSSIQSRPLRLCVSYHCAAMQCNNRFNYDDASQGRCSRHLCQKALLDIRQSEPCAIT